MGLSIDRFAFELIREGANTGLFMLVVDLSGKGEDTYESAFQKLTSLVSRALKGRDPQSMPLYFREIALGTPEKEVALMMKHLKEMGITLIARTSIPRVQAWFPHVDWVIWSGPVSKYPGIPVHELQITLDINEEPTLMQPGPICYVEVDAKDPKRTIKFLEGVSRENKWHILVHAKEKIEEVYIDISLKEEKV